MWLIDKLAERHIQEAQARGEFDNLPGAGQPLSLDDDRAVPPELRSAYRLLKNAGYLPPELQLRRDISQAEDLLAMADSGEERAVHSRRLRYLLTQLGLTCASVANLQTEQAYYARLCERLEQSHIGSSNR